MKTFKVFFSIFYTMEKECFEDIFTQKWNNITHLYAFIHKGIYYLPHTTIIRQTSERTGAINE